MKLTWTTTASLLLQEGDTIIAFDPFCGIPTNKYYAGLYRRASHVFVTHGHFDHIAQIPAIYRRRLPAGKTDAASRVGDVINIHATRTPCETLCARGVPADWLHVIRPGDVTHAGPFTVTAYQSRHCRFDMRLVAETALRALCSRQTRQLIRLLRLHRRYSERSETLFYEVVCREKRIQIMGSLNLAPGVEYPTGADLLVLPYQGKSSRSIAPYAMRILERLRPKSILIDHHDDSFPPMSDSMDPAELFAMPGCPPRAAVTEYTL